MSTWPQLVFWLDLTPLVNSLLLLLIKSHILVHQLLLYAQEARDSQTLFNTDWLTSWLTYSDWQTTKPVVTDLSLRPLTLHTQTEMFLLKYNYICIIIVKPLTSKGETACSCVLVFGSCWVGYVGFAVPAGVIPRLLLWCLTHLGPIYKCSSPHWPAQDHIALGHGANSVRVHAYLCAFKGLTTIWEFHTTCVWRQQVWAKHSISWTNW